MQPHVALQGIREIAAKRGVLLLIADEEITPGLDAVRRLLDQEYLP